MYGELNIFHLIEQEPELQISVRAALLQKKGGKWHVLLGLHRKHLKWMLPGGRIEPCEFRESAEGPLGEALIRELREELGWRVWDDIINFYPLVSHALGGRASLTWWETEDGRPRLDVCLGFQFPTNWTLCIPTVLPHNSEIIATRWVPLGVMSEDYFPNTNEELANLAKLIKRFDSNRHIRILAKPNQARMPLTFGVHTRPGFPDLNLEEI